jgi:hypothetical protein
VRQLEPYLQDGSNEWTIGSARRTERLAIIAALEAYQRLRPVRATFARNIVPDAEYRYAG